MLLVSFGIFLISFCRILNRFHSIGLIRVAVPAAALTRRGYRGSWHWRWPSRMAVHRMGLWATGRHAHHTAMLVIGMVLLMLHVVLVQGYPSQSTAASAASSTATSATDRNASPCRCWGEVRMVVGMSVQWRWWKNFVPLVLSMMWWRWWRFLVRITSSQNSVGKTIGFAVV